MESTQTARTLKEKKIILPNV
jgi:hypothetical protein